MLQVGGFYPTKAASVHSKTCANDRLAMQAYPRWRCVHDISNVFFLLPSYDAFIV